MQITKISVDRQSTAIHTRVTMLAIDEMIGTDMLTFGRFIQMFSSIAVHESDRIIGSLRRIAVINRSECNTLRRPQSIVILLLPLASGDWLNDESSRGRKGFLCMVIARAQTKVQSIDRRIRLLMTVESAITCAGWRSIETIPNAGIRHANPRITLRKRANTF
jgi:hypothetical protein